MLSIKELDVTCCHACEKWGNLADLLGGLLLGRGLGSGLLLTKAVSSSFASSASVGSRKISSSAKVRGIEAEVPKGMISKASIGLVKVIKLFTTWVIISSVGNVPTPLRGGNEIFIYF